MKLCAAVSVVSARPARLRFILFPLVSACVALAALAGMLPSAAQGQSVSFGPLQITLPTSGLVGPYGIAVDGAGNVYIADTNNRRVVEIPANGGPQIVLPFSGLASFLRSVAVDKQGDVFAASFTGGGGILLEIPAGCSSSSCQVSIPISGVGVPTGLALDNAGDIFVSDYSHGHLLEWLANCTANCQVTVATGTSQIAGLTVDSSGNVFAAAGAAILEVPFSGGQYGSPTTVVSGLQSPTGVAIDAAGSLFIADQANSQIVEVPQGCGSSSCWELLGSGLSSPGGVAVDNKGNVFAVELTDPGAAVEIARIAPNFGYVNVGSSSTLTLTYNINESVDLGATPSVVTQGAANLDFTLSGTPTCTGAQTAPTTCTVAVQFAPLAPGLREGAVEIYDSTGDLLASTLASGVGTAPQVGFPGGAQSSIVSVSSPAGIAFDGSGDLFVSAYYNSRNTPVLEFPAAGGQITVTTATSYPGGLWVDGAGNLYVPDQNNNRVLKFPAGGGSALTLGSGLSGPFDVFVNGEGSLYIADQYNHRVVEEPSVCPSGSCQVTVFSQSGTYPAGVVGDAAGDLFTNDGDSSVYEVPAVGIPATIGTGFNAPEGMRLDAAGDLFVADFFNSRVVEIPAGCASNNCQTVVGSGFQGPLAIDVDDAGNVYVGDAGHGQIVEVHRSQAPTLTFAATDVGSSSGPLTVTVQNIGNQPLTFTSFAASTYFTPDAGSTTCSTSEALAPGATCVVGADFSPTAAGNLTGTLTVTDNALNGTNVTQSVPLSGTAIAPPVVVTRFIDNATTLALSGTDNLLVYLENPDAATATVTATVTLPAGLSFLSSTGGSCNVTPSVSSNTVTLSGISLGSGVACQNGMLLQAVALGSQTASTVAAANGLTSSPYTTSVTVYDVPSSLAITGAPLGAYLGGQFSFTVTALDPLSNPDANYAGTVAFTSTDSAAALPGHYTFQPSDAGSHTFNVTLNTVGSQTVTATDSANSLSIATSGIQVVVPNLLVTLATDDDPAVATNCYSPPGSGTGGAGAGKFPNCTLRDALAAATAIGSGKITFDPTVFKASNSAALNTITLGSAGTLSIPPNTTITGAYTGAASTLVDRVTVSGNGQYTVFSVGSGTAAITGLNIVDGFSSTDGGGVNNSGSLTIANSTISNNSAMTSVDFTQLSGAGIYNSSSGTLAVSGSLISGNSLNSTSSFCSNAGGGITNAGIAVIANSTVSGNTSACPNGGIVNGGGVFNKGTLTVSGSTFNGNVASAAFGGNANGGGIMSQNNLTVTDSTFYGNSATSQGDGIGGGMYLAPSSATVVNTTVSGNSADYIVAGGGIHSSGATLNLANSVVSGNSAPAFGDLANLSGTLNNNGGNIIGTLNGSVVDSTPIDLAGLGSYGGPTQTMVPLPGSPAICGGLASNDTTANISADQRGFPLAADCPSGAVDSGAVQTAYAMSFSIQPPPATPPTLAMNPAPALSVTESGNPAAGGTVSIAGSTWPMSGTTTARVSNGTATFSNLIPTDLTTGETLIATLSLNPALTPALSLTAISNGIHVTRDTQTITFTPISGPNYVSGSVALSATATSGLTVSFVSLTPATCTVSGTSATLNASGSCTIQAEQAGGGAYAPAPNVQQTFFVSRLAQSISFPAIANSQVVNTQIPLSATATSGLAVGFVSYTPSTCTVSNSSGWTASFIAYGSCTLVAQQAGGGEYASAQNVEQILFVHHVSQNISFPAITNNQVVNTSIPLSATSTSGLAVSFVSVTPSTCTVSDGSGWSASLVASGACTLEASQSGNGVYAAAQVVSQTIFIHHLTQAISFNPIVNDQVVNTSVPLTATATSGLAVSFESTTPTTCTVSGTTASLIASGSCTLEATQSGNTVYGAAPTVSQIVFVHHLTQTVAFTAIAGTQTALTTIPLSATASSGLTVAFSSTTPATCTVSGTTASLNAYGDCTIEATQAGSSVYGSASASQTIFIHHAAQTISFPAIGSQALGTPLSLSATASSGLTVGFASTAPLVCTVSGATASFIAPGTCTIQATQPGSAVYGAAPAVSQSFTVNP